MLDKDKEGKLVEILARQAQGLVGESRDYFMNMVNQADLPQRWRGEIEEILVKDPYICAQKLIKWCITKGVNPQDRKFTTLGSILKPLVDPYLNDNDTSELPVDEHDDSFPYPLIRLIRDNNLYLDKSLLSPLEKFLSEKPPPEKPSSNRYEPDLRIEPADNEENQLEEPENDSGNSEEAKISYRLAFWSILSMFNTGSVTFSYLLLLSVPSSKDNLHTCYVPSGILIELCRNILILSLTIIWLLGGTFFREILELLGFRDAGKYSDYVRLFRILMGIVTIFMGSFMLIYHLKYGPEIFIEIYPCKEPKSETCISLYRISYKIYMVQSLINYIIIGTPTLIIIIYSQVKDIHKLDQKFKSYKEKLKTLNQNSLEQLNIIEGKFGKFKSALFEIIEERYESVFFVYCIIFGFDIAVGLIPLAKTGRIISALGYFFLGIIFIIIWSAAMHFYDQAIKLSIKNLSQSDRNDFLTKTDFMKDILQMIKKSALIRAGIFIAGLSLFIWFLPSNVINLIFEGCNLPN
jgi:hypothetical protein